MDSARPTWRSGTWIAAALVLAGLVLASGLFGVDSVDSLRVIAGLIAGAAALIIVWAVVRTRGQRRRYEAELTAWAAERAATAERLRIARELHDLASHGLGLITVRAAVARRVDGPAAPAERTQALDDIERASREATLELRRMLAVLRSPDPAPLHPMESLDALPGIVQRAADAGLDAHLDVGELADVSAGAQLAICAIAREGLANALRYAGPTRARVAVRREGDEIVVEVQDDGPRSVWHPHPGAEQGLAGLGERIAALDGSLRAAPAGDGWWLVARIPDHPPTGGAL